MKMRSIFLLLSLWLGLTSIAAAQDTNGSNKGFTDGFVYETKTEIKNQTLFIEGTVKFPNSQGSSSQAEEWKLSTDGKTLTVKTKTTGNSIVQYEKVFRLES